MSCQPPGVRLIYVSLTRRQDLLHAPNLAICEHDLAAMRMETRVRQQSGDNALGQRAGPLISLKHNLDFRARLDIVAVSAFHRRRSGHGASMVSLA